MNSRGNRSRINGSSRKLGKKEDKEGEYSGGNDSESNIEKIVVFHPYVNNMQY